MKRPTGVASVLAALLCTACDQASPIDPSAAASSAPILASADRSPHSPAAAAVARPFKGRFEGIQSVTFTPTTASAAVSATGTATRLGRFTIELPHTVDLATRTAQGTATLVAANGDMIIATFTGQAQVGAIVRIVEHATITGGTGRFAGATGSFTIERVFDPAAGITIGSFDGTISAPHDGGN